MTLSDMTKRTAAGTLALAVCLGGGALAFAGAARAAESPVIDPADFDKPSVLVASGENANLVDSVTAGPLASTLATSTLLTPRDRMDANVYGFVSTNRIEVVYIVGGNAAVSPAVENVIKSWGVKTYRIAGQDRFQTARFIADVNEQAYGS